MKRKYCVSHFQWEPALRIPSQMLMVRALELSNVDRVIALKFPAYLIRHLHKTFLDRVLNSCSGPVYVVPLAYDAPNVEEMDFDIKKDKLYILTVGHVNTNKRAASVIKALGKSRSLSKKSVYQLIGSITSQMRKELTALAKKNKVDLIISGEVDNTILARAIVKADVVTCFRWPTLEAASASTIKALLYGKATVVTNAGFYSEIPDECTIKINPY